MGYTQTPNATNHHTSEAVSNEQAGDTGSGSSPRVPHGGIRPRAKKALPALYPSTSTVRLVPGRDRGASDGDAIVLILVPTRPDGSDRSDQGVQTRGDQMLVGRVRLDLTVVYRHHSPVMTSSTFRRLILNVPFLPKYCTDRYLCMMRTVIR